MRISLLCYDLSSNALGRAHVLAQACRPLGDVQIYGPSTRGIWAPLAAREGLQTIRLRRRPLFAGDLRDAAQRIARESDVIYACKPLPTSYGLARVIRKRHGIPMVLDVDDWELGFLKVGGVGWKIRLDGLRRWREPNSYYPTARLDRRARHEAYKTVSNEFLRARFGGAIVPHGRDPRDWDPARVSQSAAKRRFGLEGRRVVLFFGSPRAHKGIDLLVDAVAALPETDIVCAIVGASVADPDAARLRAKAPDRVVLIGEQPFADAPQVVAMADIVAIPQRKNVGSIGQMPAKVYDAMAMEKPILSTQVGDIPRTLEGCGVVVEPDSAAALEAGLRQLLDDPAKARRFGSNARQRFLQRYTLEAMTATLRPLLEEAAASRSSRTV